MRTRLVFVSLVLALLAAAIANGQRPGAGTVAVQLLAINDFHGNLEPPDGASGRIGGVPAGGAEYLATHLKNDAAANPNSIIVAAGDVIGASPLVSALFSDEPTIQAMNAMNLAVSSVGNHEFDKGPAALLRLQQLAQFRYLAANVVRTGTTPRETLFPATDVRTIGGVKVAFIGETLTGTPRIVSPAGVRGLTFLDEASVANQAAAQLRSQGVNAIVLLIHEGGEQADAADVNGCDGFHGGIVPVIDKLSADIKVVVSGHTHQFYSCVIGGHYVTSASSYGRMITHVNLTIDPRTDSIVGVTTRNEVVTRGMAKDPAQTAIIATYRERSAPIANRVVGTVTGDLTRTLNPAGESRLGDVIADAQLAATRPPDKGSAVVGFTYHYRLTAPTGRHIDPASMAIDGKRIAPSASVRVAASDFLVAGGGGFTVFSEG